eukprot:5423889-Prymnesium_polylepis.2
MRAGTRRGAGSLLTPIAAPASAAGDRGAPRRLDKVSQLTAMLVLRRTEGVSRVLLPRAAKKQGSPSEAGARIGVPHLGISFALITLLLLAPIVVIIKVAVYLVIRLRHPCPATSPAAARPAHS